LAEEVGERKVVGGWGEEGNDTKNRERKEIQRTG
jgi:hypothetical protein